MKRNEEFSYSFESTEFTMIEMNLSTAPKSRRTAAERDQDFMGALERRLMNLSEMEILSVSELHQWLNSHRLEHLQDVRVVQDAVAGAFQETQVPRDMENYNRCRMMVGLGPLPLD